MEAFISSFSWNYLFLVLALFGLMGAILSLAKGIYKATSRYIGIGILLILLVMFINPLIDSVASIDISRWVSQSLNVNGNNVTATTIDNTLVSLMEATGYVNSIENPEIYQYLLEFVHAFLGLSVYLVGVTLVISVLGPLLGWIIYFVSFAIFIPAEKRKHKKHRVIAGLEGLVCGFVIGALFISPFTYVINTASQVASKVKSEEADGTIDSGSLSAYQSYIDLFASYQDSSFFSAMTLGSNDASASYDTKLMSNVTSMTIGTTETSLTEEFNAFLEIIPYLASSLSTVNGTLNFNMETLLAKDNVVSMLDVITNWKIVIGLLPAFANMANNMVSSSSGQSLNFDVDFSSVDFSGTIDDISTIYSALSDAGLIDDYVIPLIKGGKTPVFQAQYSKKSYYISAIKTLADNDILSQFLPSLMAELGQSLYEKQGVPFISTLKSDYEDIDFGADIENIIEFAFDAMHLLGYETITMDTLSNLMSTLLDTYKSKADDDAFFKALEGLICGADSITLPAVGTETEDQTVSGYKGLLSMDLLSDDIVDLSYLFGYYAKTNETLSKFFSASSLKELGLELQKDGNAGLINEFRIIIRCLQSYAKIANPSEDMKKDDGTIDYFASATVAVYKDMLSDIGDSTIIKKMLSNLVSYAAQNANLDFSFLGLSLADFNFNPVDSSGNSILIDQLSSMLDLVSTGMGIVNDLDGKTTTADYLSALNTHADDLKKVLKGVINNKILNPDKVKDGTNTVSNSNFNALIKYVMESDSLSSLGITISDDVMSMTSTEWNSEVDSLVNCISVLNTYSSVLTNDNFSISDLTEAMISDVFTALGASKLLSSSLPSLLNDKLSDAFTDLGVSVDFFAVTDWKAEGAALGKVVSSLKAVLGSKTSLADIDWLSIDTSSIKTLLNEMASTELLGVQKDDEGYYVDKFGEFVYTLIDKMGLSSDMVGDSLNESYFSSVTDKYSSTGYDKTFWVGDSASSIVGEISRICDIFDAVKAVGTANLTSGDFTGPQIKSILSALINSECFKYATSSILDYELSQFGSISASATETIDAGLVNTYVLTELSSVDLDTELTSFASVWDTINSDSFQTELESLTNLSSTAAIDDMRTLLKNMAGMKMMNEARDGEDYSFFEEIMASVLHVTTIDQLITGQSEADAKASLLPILGSVTDWDAEIDSILDAFETIISNDFLVSDFSDPDIGALNGTKISAALKAMNNSEILHKALPEFFSRIFTAVDIDSLLSYTDSSSHTYKVTINTHVRTGFTDLDIDYWDNEIDQIADLIDNLGSSDISSITIGEGGISLYKLLGPIDKMELFSEAKGMITYNLLDMNGTGSSAKVLSSYIRTEAIYLANTGLCQGASRIMTLLFPSGHTDAWFKTQCDILDGFVSLATDMVGADFDSGSDATVKSTVFNLIMSTMQVSYDTATSTASYTHCLLASEIVGNLLVSSLSSLSGWYYSDATDPTDFQYFDIVEARGLLGIMSISSLPAYTTATAAAFTNALKDVCALMGRNIGDTTAAYISTTPTTGSNQTMVDADLVLKYNALLSQTETSTAYKKYYNGSNKLNNSVIAMNLFDTYADKVTICNGRSLKDVIDYYNTLNPSSQIDVHTQSFASMADKIVSVLGVIALLP